MTLRFNEPPPHKHASLYYNEVYENLVARNYGAKVVDNNGSDPTIYWFSSTNTELAFIWASSATLWIKQRVHGGELRLTAENDTGTECDLFKGDPEGDVQLFYEDVLTVKTTNITHGATAGDEGGIEVMAPNGTDGLIITRNNGVSATIFVDGYGDYLRIGGEDSGGGAASSIVCVPAGYTEIRYNEVKSFQSSAEGIKVFDTSGDDPVISLNDDASTEIGVVRGVNGTDIYVDSDVGGSEIWLGAAHVELAKRWVGLSSGAAAWYPSPDDTLSTGRSTNVWTDVYATSGSVNTSDLRKKNLIGDSLGLEFVSKLRPVTYSWKKGKRPHQGLIAQDVKKTMDELGIDDFAGYIDPYVTEFPEGENAWKPKGKGESKPHLGLRYHEFIPPVIKAIQQLKAELDQLKNEVQYQQWH